MLKGNLLFKKNTTLRKHNSRILRIQNAKFSGYDFYMNRNIWRDFLNFFLKSALVSL